MRFHPSACGERSERRPESTAEKDLEKPLERHACVRQGGDGPGLFSAGAPAFFPSSLHRFGASPRPSPSYPSPPSSVLLVGLDLEGRELGRFGPVSLLQLSFSLFPTSSFRGLASPRSVGELQDVTPSFRAETPAKSPPPLTTERAESSSPSHAALSRPSSAKPPARPPVTGGKRPPSHEREWVADAEQVGSAPFEDAPAKPREVAEEEVGAADAEEIAADEARLALAEKYVEESGVVCVIDLGEGNEERKEIVDLLKPVLEDNLVPKIMHDCREDSAALKAQFGVSLRGVLDTQAAFQVLREAQRLPAYATGLTELLQQELALIRPVGKAAVARRMRTEAHLWTARPVPRDLLEYAIQDVLHLAPLIMRLKERLQDAETSSPPSPGGALPDSPPSSTSSLATAASPLLEETKYRSELFASSGSLNLNWRDLNAVFAAGRGARVQAMLTAVHPGCMYFRLNLSRQSSGIITLPSMIHSLRNVRVGETIDAVVRGWSDTGRTLYLDVAEDSPQAKTQRILPSD
ncbi:hypothetical protein BESB_047470 [Besnoitia besnoiti]|uniref:3'-5' exonuclease domain-containing protein n=1 Tax=Besnoitia besnoiti TaxID=94643 RepID=A0A2A9MEZ1_BESBE|nr:hypothetical protein BESB_047470 [Besnoitia besnoiti]PFH36555.1 hypothetical protein BESB_047470 [Besnoitia besnoiti]